MKTTNIYLVIQLLFFLNQNVYSSRPTCVYPCSFTWGDKSVFCYESLNQMPLNTVCQSAIKLDITHNNISVITNGSMSDYPQLTHIQMYQNQIRVIEPGSFSQLSKLKILDFWWNQISSLPDYLLYNMSDTIQKIDLTYNQITEINEHIFSNLPSLYWLSLQSNKINHIHSNAFSNSTNLTHLCLGQNQLRELPSDIFKDLTNLTDLDLYSNQLTYISEELLRSLTKLEHLYLQNNSIVEIPSIIFEISYCKIFLNDNKLTIIPISYNATYQLELLELSKNLITDATNLTYFVGHTKKLYASKNPFICDCAYNEIRTINKVNCNYMKCLYNNKNLTSGEQDSHFVNCSGKCNCSRFIIPKLITSKPITSELTIELTTDELTTELTTDELTNEPIPMDNIYPLNIYIYIVISIFIIVICLIVYSFLFCMYPIDLSNLCAKGTSEERQKLLDTKNNIRGYGG